ncbi:MAG: peptidylprolyl isomerase [Alphaproteobacteria bacterium]
MLAKSLAAAIGLLAFCSAALAQDQSTAGDAIVATVDDQEIHRSDVEAVMRTLPDQMRQAPIEQIYPMLLDRVIDFKLLEFEAEKSDLADDPDVQPALAQARAAVLRDAMLRRKVEEGSTDEALKARYEEMKKADGFAYEEVHARHILLASEDDAKAVITELEGGADFETLAKEKSTGPSGPQGGDLGYFRKGQMVPEFGDAAFAMEIGSTSSEPVQTQFGFHVIKVEDKRKVEPSFEESEPQIRQDVAREIVTALVEDLRDGVSIKRFNLDGSPMAAPEGAAEGGDKGQTKNGG